VSKTIGWMMIVVQGCTTNYPLSHFVKFRSTSFPHKLIGDMRNGKGFGLGLMSYLRCDRNGIAYQKIYRLQSMKFADPCLIHPRSQHYLHVQHNNYTQIFQLLPLIISQNRMKLTRHGSYESASIISLTSHSAYCLLVTNQSDCETP
jgi:hypothetical protein